MSKEPKCNSECLGTEEESFPKWLVCKRGHREKNQLSPSRVRRMTSTFVFSKILMSYTWWPKRSSQCLGGEGRRNRAHLQWDGGQPGIHETVSMTTVSMTTNHSKILTLTVKSCVGKPCWNFLPSHRSTIISPSLSSSPVLALFALSFVGVPTMIIWVLTM